MAEYTSIFPFAVSKVSNILEALFLFDRWILKFLASYAISRLQVWTSREAQNENRLLILATNTYWSVPRTASHHQALACPQLNLNNKYNDPLGINQSYFSRWECRRTCELIDDEGIAKNIYEEKVSGKISRGRPRLAFETTASKILEDEGHVKSMRTPQRTHVWKVDESRRGERGMSRS